jgi:hypothetical protein
LGQPSHRYVRHQQQDHTAEQRRVQGPRLSPPPAPPKYLGRRGQGVAAGGRRDRLQQLMTVAIIPTTTTRPRRPSYPATEPRTF